MGHTDTNTNSGVLWKYVNADFARQKNQKFKDLLLDKYDDFFSAQNVGEATKICALTGIEANECQPLVDKQDKNAPTLFFLPSVIEQIERGRELNKAENGGNIKSFSDYANGSYLGVLRMDVDGLGKRFILGFDNTDNYKKFSDKVTQFFENSIGGAKDTNVPKFIDRPTEDGKHTYRDYLNVIYAGGDDLFIVGKWDVLIDFAKVIHDETEKHFADEAYNEIIKHEDGRQEEVHHKISISGGIAIVSPTFPIAKAATLAGEAEDAAKSVMGKNSFCLFGETLSWNGEFQKVENYKNKFVTAIKDHGVSRAFLHKIILYNEISKSNEKSNRTRDYRYIWHSAYYFKRYQQRYKQEKSLFTDIRNGILNENELRLMSVAARWAEISQRFSNK